MKNYKMMSLDEKKTLVKAELLRIHKLLGKSPTKEDFKAVKDTKVSYGQIVYLYKKWNLAIKDAGLKNNKQRLPATNTKERSEIIEAFITVANIEQRMPTFREFQNHFEISLSPFLNIFGSWNGVKQYAYAKHRDQLTFLPTQILPRRNRRTKKQIALDKRNGLK